MKSYRSRLPSRWIVLLLLSTLGLAPVPAVADSKKKEQEPDPAARARMDFHRMKESQALLWDWRTILSFLELEGDDILRDLVAAYKRPPTNPQQQLRYLLATGIRLRYCERIRGAKHPPSQLDESALLEFSTNYCKKRDHAWGAFNAFTALAKNRVALAALKEQASEGNEVFLRAAAIESLGQLDDEALLDFLGPLLQSAMNSKKKEERILLTEAIVWAMANICARLRGESDWLANINDWGDALDRREYHRRRRRRAGHRRDFSNPADRPRDVSPANDAAVRRALERLGVVIDLLDRDDLHARTRFQIQLSLRHALGTKGMFTAAQSWRHVLESSTEPPEKEKKGAGRTVLNFMGIESRGKRIVFVLDSSDSMLTPLGAKEKAALRALLSPEAEEATDQDTSKNRRRTSVRRRTAFDSDWDKIVTRFDAARAHLKHTLSKMDPKVQFAVVLFGNRAELLKRTPRLVPGTATARTAVARELNAIQPGPRGKDRPHGRLRGQTNVHAAFDLAFRVDLRRVGKDPNAYVNPGLLLSGADTIFFLTDGEPTVDDFGGLGPWVVHAARTTRGGDVEIVDPETGAKKTVRRQSRQIPETKRRDEYSTGPYTGYSSLVEDIRRQNLFRRAVIHVVGIGEAGQELPRRLSEIGHGQWIRVDSKER